MYTHLTVPAATLFLFALVNTSLRTAARPAHIRQDCVLAADGRSVCVKSVALSSTARLSRPAPCPRHDLICWCIVAVKYTNDVRRAHGRKPLKVGPLKQLDNAVRYAAVMPRLNKLKHQKLDQVTKEVGCKRWLGGENVAANFEPHDVAYRAVQQWVESVEHRKNLLRDWFEEAVVGFYFAPNGQVFAVQTFSLVYIDPATYGSLADPRCKAVQADGGRYKVPPLDGASGKGRDTGNDSQSKASPKPNSPEFSRKERLRQQGNRSCKCLENGTECWHSLQERSGNHCAPFRRADDQPYACKRACCDYCNGHAANPRCNNAVVKRLCPSV